MNSILHRLALVLSVLSLALGGRPARAEEPAAARFDFRRDPALQGFTIQGPDDGRFAWTRGRGVTLRQDSRDEAARLVAPLPFVLDGSSSFEVSVDLVLVDLAASPADFFQVAFGLISSETTGFYRTGRALPVAPFFVDDSDVFDSVELAYFPNVTAFGGPTLSPTVFGAELGSAFSNFAANFGPSADLGDNSDGAVTELPIGRRLRVVMKHDACRQELETTVLRVGRDGSAELETGLLPVDLRFVNLSGSFRVDSLAFHAYQDLADFDPSTPSLLATVRYLEASVTPRPEPTARLLPATVQPSARGEAHVRIDAWRRAAGPVRLVEAGGAPVDVSLEARPVGPDAALARLPRELATLGDLVLDLDGCRVAVAGPRRVLGR